MDSTVLKGIKARLWSGNRPVTLEFTNEEDKSGEGSKMDKENNNKNEDN